MKKVSMLPKWSPEQLADLETPFYYYDLDRLDRNIDVAQEAAAKGGYHIHYALKANADPASWSVFVKLEWERIA